MPCAFVATITADFSSCGRPVRCCRLYTSRCVTETGLLANPGALGQGQLDARRQLVEEVPETFGNNVSALHLELGMKVLGGCCGTDQRHIECLARGLSEN